MAKTIYLTIDDGPSVSTMEKVDWLAAHGIPAILFFIGSHIAAHPDAATHAIARGFWVGNHAYSHRRFSQLDPSTWRAELAATEELIAAAYRRAGTPRVRKLFRFPFGDKGAARRAEIQAILRAEGFQQPSFPSVTYAKYVEAGYPVDADCYWTIESYEYKLASADDNLAALRTPHARTGGSVDDSSSADIFLIHDHPATTAVFFEIVERLLRGGVRFALP
jgi:peptidoglycan/xylan/chitin deacetylase (PgdA/CDA1 family)